MLTMVGWRRSFRASPAGKPAIQNRPFKMDRGPAYLAGARSSTKHPIRAGCFDQFQQTGQHWPV
jgi:hypothetical protein